MTQGFYEQLGVRPDAPPGEIRAAYGRVVRQIRNRRRALVEQGGDTARLDQHRRQVDEAWEVLSDPRRRRRYDAMVALRSDGGPTDSETVWKQASGALAPPASSAAAELLRVTSTLKVGALPPAPRPGGSGGATPDEPTQAATQPTVVPPSGGDDDTQGSVVSLPTPEPSLGRASLRVVDDSDDEGGAVLEMPTGGSSRELTADGVADLVDRHGWSGALLCAVREARGLSLQDMSDSTRISVRYLEAVERDDYERLPSPTFVRGYVREMARLLEVDEAKMVEGYMRRFSGG